MQPVSGFWPVLRHQAPPRSSEKTDESPRSKAVEVKFHIFPVKNGPDLDAVRHTLETVARGTDTGDLVVALYILPGKHQCRGTAYVQQWLEPGVFLAPRGKWAFAKRFGMPPDLPDRFKLIRMRLDGDDRLFPRTERDGYRWEFQYGSFLDQLALLFAHELHHYRRHHLHFHPRGGETAANVWALNHVRRLEYCVSGKPLPTRKKRFSPRGFLIRRLPHLDPYARFRSLKPGNRLIVSRDPRNQYQGQSVVLIRSATGHSKRLVIQTEDGKLWRWPMEWLEVSAELQVSGSKFEKHASGIGTWQ
jgi:hypothetical protein